MAGSYWNHIRWRCSTGGKLTKTTPFFACWRREERREKEEGERGSKKEERGRRRETMTGHGREKCLKYGKVW